MERCLIIGEVIMALKLDDIFGQETAVDFLSRAYLADRLPHGVIFAGPAGVARKP